MRSVLGGLEDVRVVPLSDEWVIVLVNSKWHAHDAGRITKATLATLQEELGRISANVLLCVHHPPVSPCPNDDCGMVDGMQLVDLLVDSPVRAVLSGHVHQQFDTTRGGIRFLATRVRWSTS